MWYHRLCLGWVIDWISGRSGYCSASGVGVLKFSSSVCYGRSAVIKPLGEETDSWSPIRWVDLGYEWILSEVPIREDSLSASGISEKEGWRFSKVD